jgi:CubicO group peptidase (beta-lactamase class C family)
MRTLRIVASLLLSMASVCGARADAIDEYVRAAMAQEKTPGLVLAISSPQLGEVIRPYGLANLEHQVPVRPETLFQSGSTGKQFTAAAVLLQVEDGKLKLDDSIAQYFPSERPSWRAITIGHLLSHTSGLPDYTEGQADVDLRRDYSEEDLVQLAMKLQPEFAPGARWAYSNTGYVVLGALVRKVAGKFYGDILRERIFSPARMQTARVISEAELVPNRAAGYELVDGNVRNQSWISPSLNTTADGSLYLSARDWLAWDAVLRARRLLSRESYESMWTSVRLANGQSYPYGFGWFIEEQRGSPLIEHGGTWQGFHAHIARYVERELTIVALCNIDTCRPTRIARCDCPIQWVRTRNLRAACGSNAHSRHGRQRRSMRRWRPRSRRTSIRAHGRARCIARYVSRWPARNCAAWLWTTCGRGTSSATAGGQPASFIATWSARAMRTA